VKHATSRVLGSSRAIFSVFLWVTLSSCSLSARRISLSACGPPNSNLVTGAGGKFQLCTYSTVAPTSGSK